jgi:hypothetical protein
VLAKARPGIRFNEHIEGDGPTVFAHVGRILKVTRSEGLPVGVGWSGRTPPRHNRK